MITISLTPEELNHLTTALELHYIKESEYHGYDEHEKAFHVNELRCIGALLRRLENYYEDEENNALDI